MNFSRKKLREWARTLGFMAVSGTVCIAALATAYQVTRTRIAANEQATLRRAVLAAAGIEDLPASPAALAERFAALARPLAVGYLVGADLVVMPQSGTGLWGPIQAMVGYDRSRQRLSGIAFLAHQETPGLGARIEEPWFIRQFPGLPPPITLATPGVPRQENQFDAITGATITSTAVRDLVNAAVAKIPPADLNPKPPSAP